MFLFIIMYLGFMRNETSYGSENLNLGIVCHYTMGKIYSFSMQIIGILYFGHSCEKRQKFHFNKYFKIFFWYFDPSEKPKLISGIGSKITQ